MKIIRPLKFLAVLLSVVGLSSVLSVAVTTKSFSESYPGRHHFKDFKTALQRLPK